MLKGGRVQKNVVLISPRLVLPNELQKDITIVDFDLPDYRDIKQSLISIINANRGNTKIHFNLDEAGVDNLAKAAQGLTLQEAENAFARAMIERGCLDQDSVDIIVEEKRQIIKKTGVLEKITDGLQYLYVNTTIQIHFRLVAGFATSLKRIYAVTMTSAIL